MISGGAAQVAQRIDRRAVQVGIDDVKPLGARPVEGLTQVEQRQRQVAPGLREREFVFRPESDAFVQRRFGVFAVGHQCTAAFDLLAAQGQLAFGHGDQLLVEKHLEVERHHIDGHILAGPLEVGDGRPEVEFPARDLPLDPQSLEYGQAR